MMSCYLQILNYKAKFSLRGFVKSNMDQEIVLIYFTLNEDDLNNLMVTPRPKIYLLNY
jgi:hypothetical protein